MEVIKRDGRYAVFDKDKIIKAVEAAFNDVDHEVSYAAQKRAAEIASYIEGMLEDHDYMQVETIQDIVEQKLMASSRKDVAKAYIIYRNDRNRVRERNSKLM